MKEAILQLLRSNRGAPVSGEDLSSQLQVTRAAIWKHIKTLRQEGHEIISKSKVGYMLVDSPERLYKAEIKADLGQSIFGTNICYYDQVESTNTVAKKMADSGGAHGTLVLAEKQLAGRGRRGRQWLSDNHDGLWFSVILRPEFPPLQAPNLTFVAAVAVVKSIALFTGMELELKWPNDIYSNGKKVAGILTEMKAELDQIEYVVMGIGINVNQVQEDFSPELAPIATSLGILLGAELERQRLLVATLKQLELWYQCYLTEGFAQVLEEWRTWDITVGSQVTVMEAANSYTGYAISVDQDGFLLVRNDQGIVKKVASGEVSIRVRG